MRKQAIPETETALQAVFLRALRQRVAANPCGKVLLPVGPVAASELAQVLRALDRATELKNAPRSRGMRIKHALMLAQGR
jgi:hypothetical protein